MSKFSKSLTDRGYSRYLNLKPGLVHDWDHFISLFDTKFFSAKAKFTLTQLGRAPQYPWEDLDACVKKLSEKALDCCVLVAVGGTLIE